MTINTLDMKTHPFLRKTTAGISGTTASLLGSFAFTLALSNVFGQTYHYEFSIEGITDVASAKEVTDLLRTEFNDGNDPFKYYPAFNDESDTFDFRSDILVAQERLENLLERESYVLNSWKLSEKRKEE